MLNVDEDDETHEKKMKQAAAAEQREEMRLQHKTARYFFIRRLKKESQAVY